MTRFTVCCSLSSRFGGIFGWRRDFAMLNNIDGNNAPMHCLTPPNGNTGRSQITKIDI